MELKETGPSASLKFKWDSAINNNDKEQLIFVGKKMTDTGLKLTYYM